MSGQEKYSRANFISVFTFFYLPIDGGASPQEWDGFFFSHGTTQKIQPVCINKKKKRINYPEYPGHCKRVCVLARDRSVFETEALYRRICV
jgi:hypothetical protein